MVDCLYISEKNKANGGYLSLRIKEDKRGQKTVIVPELMKVFLGHRSNDIVLLPSGVCQPDYLSVTKIF